MPSLPLIPPQPHTSELFFSSHPFILCLQPPMATSHHFSNDSFSMSWLINIKTSVDFCSESHKPIDTQDCSSFTEMDSEFFSMRWINDANDFGFSHPSSQPSDVIHADQIIRNGQLFPLHVASAPNSIAAASCNSFGSTVCSRTQSVDSATLMVSPISHQQEKYYFNTLSSKTISASPSSELYSSKSTTSSSESSHSKDEKFKSPVVIRSCVFMSPKKILCKYLCFLMPLYKKIRGFRLRTLKFSRSCRTSVQNSPGTSNAFSSREWCRSNADISIYDAIVHCKRSNVQEKLWMGI